MSFYVIKINDNIPVGFPMGYDNFKYLHPEIEFPDIPTPEILQPWGYVVYITKEPSKQTDHFTVLEEEPPLKVGDHYEQQWMWRPMTDEERLIQEQRDLEIEQQQKEFLEKLKQNS